MLTIYDPDTKVLRPNPEFERLIGWSSAEAAGVSLMQECYPDPAYREDVARFMRTCRDGWMDIRMRTRDQRDIETSWANVRLSDRTQVGIGIEITARKRDEEAVRRSEQEFRALAENTVDLIARFDRDFRHLYVNPRVEAATGLAAAVFIGKTNRDLGMPEDLCAAGEARVQHVFETGQPATLEFTFPSPNGPRHFHSWFGPEFSASGSVETVICITRDVTEQKELEQELRSRMADLAEADRRKDEFIATAGPRAAQPAGPDPQRAPGAAGWRRPTRTSAQRGTMMDRQVGHMVRLIDDLLDVSRISRNKMELRRTRVGWRTWWRAPSRPAARLSKAAGTSSTVALPPEPVYLDADLARLAQVVRQPAQQHRQVHRPGRAHPARPPKREGDEVVVSRPRTTGSASPPRPAADASSTCSRQVDRCARAVAGRAGHRPGAGQGAGRDARRHGRGPERRPGQGQHVHRPPAGRCVAAAMRRRPPADGREAGARARRPHPGGRTTTGTPRPVWR